MKALFIGVGAAAVAPKVLPAIRPLAKAIIKAGLLAYDQGRVTYSELSEQAGDLIAEARAELAEFTGFDSSRNRSRQTRGRILARVTS